MVTQEELCICYTVNFFPIKVKSINCAFLLQVGLDFIGSIERIKFLSELDIRAIGTSKRIRTNKQV